jgi:hypothetical protein
MNRRRILSALAALLALATVVVYAANELQITDTAIYNRSGVTITLNDTYYVNITGTNASYSTFNCASNGSTFSVSPLISNGVIRVKNLASTNAPTNYIEIGNNGTNYPVRILPGEVARGRLVLDGTGLLYCRCATNGPVSVGVGWVPN